MTDYQFPCSRRDENSSGGEKVVYTVSGVIEKRLNVPETQSTERV